MRKSESPYVRKIARLAVLAPTVIALLTALTVRADDPKPEEKKWESVATLGATLTRGNSHTFLGTIALNTKRKWTDDELLFGANAGYGETTVETSNGKEDHTTDSYIKGFGQYNHLFTPRFYSGLRLYGEHDDIANLTYRFTVSPQVGYYFIKQTNTFLAGEIGPSYVKEKLWDPHHEKNYFALRVAERGEHKFASGAKIWEGLEWLPQVDHFNNYVANAEAGVSAPISKSFSLSLVAQDTYRNKPAEHKLKNDFKLIAGVSYNF